MSEFGKRVDGIHGRRAAVRESVSLPASLFSLEYSRVVIAEDISTTGAHLVGGDLPEIGEDIWLKVGPIDVFATVVWREARECGVTFDKPLGNTEASFVEHEAKMMRLTHLKPQERTALDDWRRGVVR